VYCARARERSDKSTDPATKLRESELTLNHARALGHRSTSFIIIIVNMIEASDVNPTSSGRLKARLASRVNRTESLIADDGRNSQASSRDAAVSLSLSHFLRVLEAWQIVFNQRQSYS